MGCANFEGVVRVLCEFRTSFTQAEGVVRVLCEFRTSFAQAEGVVRISSVVRISHKPGAVVFQMPYLPHFSSKLSSVGAQAYLLRGIYSRQVEHMTAYRIEQPGRPQPAARRASPRHILRTSTASQSSLAQEMATIRACQEQMLTTQAQHTTILRQLQHHLGLPSAAEHFTPTTTVPHSQATEPQAPPKTATEEAEPSA
ncbi:hypothetical protein CK203_055688 [Vitis vinifera]|uniref:Uncharacterized protein n=1 Tax=Vitis vinifera TaxID=29760 RepID=A0A438FVC5_VITVI|nr:hypothetical protein CK203_055688 [Vitis vinifera]